MSRRGQYGRLRRKGYSTGIGDFVDKAKDAVAGNADKVKEGIDKGADLADEKTGGKFSSQIDQGADTAKDVVDKLSGGE